MQLCTSLVHKFHGNDEAASERALENALLARLKDFLIELGSGFAFVGNQYRLEVDGEEFFLDLLFYHTRLQCCIVIDLKVGEFKPEFVGKMNFYQAAVDNAGWPTGPAHV